MAAHDYLVLRAADDLVSAAYLSQQRLDRGTKDLLFIISLTVLSSDKEHI
jgi:4-carboxymuconolactone decarboxylase